MKRFKARQTCLAFMMLILSVFLITGCGSNGQTGHWLAGLPESNNPDITKPTVTAVVPLSGATVPINTKVITAAFSEAMLASTITATGTFTLACPGYTPVAPVVTYLEAILQEKLPKSVIIIGAGAIGMEFATVWNSYGVDVTVVEAMPVSSPAKT